MKIYTNPNGNTPLNLSDTTALHELVVRLFRETNFERPTIEKLARLPTEASITLACSRLDLDAREGVKIVLFANSWAEAYPVPSSCKITAEYKSEEWFVNEIEVVGGPTSTSPKLIFTDQQQAIVDRNLQKDRIDADREILVRDQIVNLKEQGSVSPFTDPNEDFADFIERDEARTRAQSFDDLVARWQAESQARQRFLVSASKEANDLNEAIRRARFTNPQGYHATAVLRERVPSKPKAPELTINMNTLFLWEAMLKANYKGEEADLVALFDELGTAQVRAIAIGMTELFESTWNALTPVSRLLIGSINADFARLFVMEADWNNWSDLDEDESDFIASEIDDHFKRLTRLH